MHEVSRQLTPIEPRQSYGTAVAGLGVALPETVVSNEVVAERIGKDVKAFPVNYWDGMPPEVAAQWSSLKKGLHAHTAEVSAVMAINPDLVDTEKLNAECPNFPEYTIANIGAAHTAYFFTSPGSVYWATRSGTWGEARDSTPEKGREYLDLCVQSTLAVLENIENTFRAMPVRD